MRNLLKRIFVFCSAIAAAGLLSVGAVTVSIGDMELPGAQLINSTTYVPLREFVSALDECTVIWDSPSSTAAVTAAGLDLQVKHGAVYLMANNRALYLYQPVTIQNGVMLVPVRALSKALGAEVGWDSATKSATITPGGAKIENGETFYNQDDLLWLSRLIHAESQGEPLEGQIAVGNVVLNRVVSPDFPSNIYDVIFDDMFGVQFTPVANNTINNTPLESCVIAAKLSLEGVQVVPGALYFQNPVIATSRWISENCEYLKTVGNHKFYK